jgi:hypothetical protein
MTEITYSRKETDNLTQKLGEFAKAKLEDPEWALLLAIFAAAADRVVVSEDTHSGTFAGVEISGIVEVVESPGESDVETLRDQLFHAHTPGKVPPKGNGDSVTPR